MTDQEIINALRENPGSDNMCHDCALGYYATIAADRLEELTASQHVMKMREDA